MRYWKLSAVFGLALFGLAGASQAHEFIVKPDIAHAKSGTLIPVSIYATETYIKPHRLPPESTQVKVINGADEVPLSVVADSDAKIMRAAAKAPDATTFIIAGYSLRDRAAGKPSDKAAADNAASSAQTHSQQKSKILRMETFSKAFINLQKEDDGYAQIIGSTLEVVPQQNLAALKKGDALAVKILLNGKPIAARVQATYDGFSDKEHGYVVRTESDANGIAQVAISAPGVWLIRTKYTSVQGDATKGFDSYEASANIVFTVN